MKPCIRILTCCALIADCAGRKKSNVGSLPWLILANNKHSAVSEGFVLEELHDELQKIGDK